MIVNNQKAEKNYSVVPNNMIKLFSEISGYSDLDENVYDILSEDVTFRINEILNQSKNLQNLLCKEKLTVNEINLILKYYNCKPIYGHEDNEQIKSIFDEKEKPIDLFKETSKILKQKQFIMVKSCKFNYDFVDLKYSKTDLINQADIDENLKELYNFLTKNIFSTNQKVFQSILNDLSINKEINEILIYLMNYFNNNFNLLKEPKDNLLKTLLIIEYLFKNPLNNLKFQKCIITVIDFLFSCLLEDFNLDGTQLNYLFKLRNCSAKLLISIIFKYHDILNDNNVIFKILNLLLNKFQEINSLDVKYGIITFFQNLNPTIFFNIFFPFLIEFISGEEIKIFKNIACQNEKQLLKFILITIVNCFNFINCNNHVKIEYLSNHYLNAYNVYGDSFSNLLIIEYDPRFKSKKIEENFKNKKLKSSKFNQKKTFSSKKTKIYKLEEVFDNLVIKKDNKIKIRINNCMSKESTSNFDDITTSKYQSACLKCGNLRLKNLRPNTKINQNDSFLSFNLLYIL